MKIIYKTIKIKFYDRLIKFLPSKYSKQIIHKFIDQTSVKDLIESFNIPHVEVDVILVNGKSVGFEYIIKDKDKINVYPNSKRCLNKNVKKLKPKLLGKPKFIADVHLGKLVKEMRKLGLDVKYSNQYRDEEIVEISNKEKRLILTRDLGLIKRKSVQYGMYLLSEKTSDQLKEIFQNTNIYKSINPLSICLECGLKLKRISKRRVFDQLKNYKFDQGTIFYSCQNCKKIYWQGSHFKRMLETTRKYLHILNYYSKVD